MAIYCIQELGFAFPQHKAEALSDINLTIQSGEFAVISGVSGSGKSTLLRQLKPNLTPHGRRRGQILYRGSPIEEIDHRTQAAEIGYVLQDVDNQIVTDKVWHELAFGLESLGCDQRVIRLRVAEMASFFGIQTWFDRNVAELSGGQKQLLNLASIMAMHPSVLILDEPTSQLDPIAAAEFLETVKKINRDLGTTVILSEHRLEEVLPMADRLIVIDNGKLEADGHPREVGLLLNRRGHPMFAAMPTPMQIQAAVDNGPSAPLTVKEGRQWLDDYCRERESALNSPTAGNISADREQIPDSREIAVQLKDVWFKYEKQGPDIIKDLSFEVREGEFYCLVGGNGTGKTTALSLISGIRSPYRGKVLLFGKNRAKMSAKECSSLSLGVLPQNPQTLFMGKTVEQDLYDMLSNTKWTKEEKQEKVDSIVKLTELEHVLSRHPYDLSGGEQQRAALAKVLLMEPAILLLDEPTKGLDVYFKIKLADLLNKLRGQGMTILMVSHDIEFCAKYGERCSLFFNGSIVTTNEAKPFFAGNSFYTTAANRMARHVWKDAVTIEDVVYRCQQIGP